MFEDSRHSMLNGYGREDEDEYNFFCPGCDSIMLTLRGMFQHMEDPKTHCTFTIDMKPIPQLLSWLKKHYSFSS